MTETFEQNVLNILASIRDNLLKPMATEIEETGRANRAEIHKVFADGNTALLERFNALQLELQAMKEAQNSFKEKMIKGASEAKWNE